MGESGSGPIWLRDRRLAPLATSALPAWLWARDGSRLLWANPTGAAIFGAATPAALAARQFDGGQQAAAQIARLAATLPAGGTPRLERLRGFAAGIGRALTCFCSSITLPDSTPAILVVAAERAGPDLPFDERLRRLLAGADERLAIFSANGALIHATPAAGSWLNGRATLSGLGVEALAGAATETGHAAGDSAIGPLGLHLVGGAGATALVATVAGLSPATAPAPVASETPRPAEAMGSTSAAAASPAPMERRHPLRFVWQMDDEGRFTIGSNEFVELAGPQTATVLDRPWHEVSAALGLDPEGLVARALETHETWSGISVSWSVGDNGERLAVELSGLPVFDRERSFRGYRGFGVCRDVERLNALAQARHAASMAAAARPVPEAQPPADEQAAKERAANPPGKRPALALVPPAENVVPFRAPASDANSPSLNPVERRAFRELSRRLTERLNHAEGDGAEVARDQFLVDPEEERDPNAEAIFLLLDRFPIGVLIYRLSHLLYANPAFLDWTGYETLEELAEAGGLDSLFVEPGAVAIEEGGRKAFIITSARGDNAQAESRLFLIPWEGDSAFALVTIPASEQLEKATDLSRPEISELNAILDTATDGVIVLDRDARIVSANRSAQALFGYESAELCGKPFVDLLAPESVGAALDYLGSLQNDAVAAVLNRGRDVIGRERTGGLIPLFMTLGRIGEGGKLCAVFRDITPWKKAEEGLIEARRHAENASSAKSDFLAKISHEIRTPLNAIIGFSEVMMEERFGPVGNDRYRQYLRDIHTSGGHLISLINDLLDLSKIDAGKLELTFAGVSLNDLTQQCVAIMQPQANRERIIIRTSLSPKLPQVVADARSVRQIVLNLVSNSIKFTSAGGQVIVSTAITDAGEVLLRVRDTGMGMSEKDIATALEPFRQLATSTRWSSGGTGLGLPLTKALAEANRASFHIKSTPNAGTLVEIGFPAARVLAG